MTGTPPIPAESQSPYPLQEPPHPRVEPAPTGPADAVATTLNQGLDTARATVGPLAERAKTFARERPWATAALVGSIAVAVINSLRGRRA